jgi:26S proteasome regulatory subunit T4
MYYLLQNCQGFNGADLRNVCTEAGMSAIRAERDYVIHEDFMKVSSLFSKQVFLCFDFSRKGFAHCISLLGFQAVRKLNEAKKLESSAHYNADFGKE